MCCLQCVAFEYESSIIYHVSCLSCRAVKYHDVYKLEEYLSDCEFCTKVKLGERMSMGASNCVLSVLVGAKQWFLLLQKEETLAPAQAAGRPETRPLGRWAC